jgi:beta-glucanase (GH16 family)
MKRLIDFGVIILLVAACEGNKETKQQEDDWKIPTTGYSTPESYPEMNLVWQDEFERDHLNLADWKHEIGGRGWGNNELQYYQEKNAAVREGYLIITAKKENAGGRDYTSSRIITQGKKEFQYGRIDIRALLPKGQGIWPALWMLGNNISTVNWPACGEIDIMEMVGGSGKENTVHGTAHWENEDNHIYKGDSLALEGNKIFADEFHVFSIVWTSTAINWYVDDVQYYTLDITPPELSELQNKAYFIFNVAVGGNWPGNPDASTEFPQRMVVDYIRVFQPR